MLDRLLDEFDQDLREVVDEVVGLTLKDNQWAQATLPIKEGGLGLQGKGGGGCCIRGVQGDDGGSMQKYGPRACVGRGGRNVGVGASNGEVGYGSHGKGNKAKRNPGKG